ncbi:MAG: substrate-binding domain-containing protein [Akkermansiaceae bacterium]|nr:substrate-binding domain-containing protein [Akkermansiaceae bacterium]
MSHHINRNYLPVQVAERMHQEILAGAWSGRLPGRRVLAKRYQVSEKTCAAAISILAKQGVLTSGGHGKPWQIKPSWKPATTTIRGKNLLILYNTSSPPTHEDDSLLHSIETAWQGAAGHPLRKGVDFDYYKHPASYLKEMIHRDAADALFLLSPPIQWAKAAHQMLPVFQISGTLCSDTPTSYFPYSTEVEIARLTRYLAGLGHRKILIPWREEIVLPFIMKGLHQGFEGQFTEKQLAPYCPLVTGDTPEAWTRFWHQSMSTLEPSAIIVFDDRHLVSLYSFCSRAGIQIPTHLSVILVTYNPLSEWFRPMPTMACFPNNTVLDHFERWMSNGYQACGVHYLPLDRIDGGSVARPSSVEDGEQ